MKRLKLNISVKLFVLLAVVFVYTSPATAKDMSVKEPVAGANITIKSIPVSEANEMLGKNGVMFLDVRDPDAFQSGHLPGAINIPEESVESQIEKQMTDKTATMVVYCQGGRRSALVTQTLVKMGYKNVLNMEGGYKAWLKAGYSVLQVLEKSK